MFIHKNLIHEAQVAKRNSFLKGLSLFLLGASAVLLFSSADLILNPYITNSYVYLQKMFFSPNGTSNTQATITLDGWSGAIIASGITTKSLNTTDLFTTNMDSSVLTAAVATITNKLNTNNVCDSSQNNCFNPSSFTDLSGSVSSISGKIETFSWDLWSLIEDISSLEEMLQLLSGRVAALE